MKSNQTRIAYGTTHAVTQGAHPLDVKFALYPWLMEAPRLLVMEIGTLQLLQ